MDIEDEEFFCISEIEAVKKNLVLFFSKYSSYFIF